MIPVRDEEYDDRPLGVGVGTAPINKGKFGAGVELR
jgi:hypothetical protein